MANFTFYHNPASRGAIAHWALHEVGADFDAVIVDWGALPDGLTQANPMGKVPTLVHHHGDHDHTISEAPAICHYLAHTHPDAGLLPDDHEAASYFRWLFFAAGPIEAAVTAKAMGWNVPEGKAGMAGFGTYELAVGTLDSWLSQHDFVSGDRFTMADVYVGAQVIWGLMFGSLPERESFKAYRDRCEAREGRQAARAIDDRMIAEMQG